MVRNYFLSAEHILWILLGFNSYVGVHSQNDEQVLAALWTEEMKKSCHVC